MKVHPTYRNATENDIPALFALDLVAHKDTKRRKFIRQAVASGMCFVARYGVTHIAAYGVMSCSFFENGFIEMLYVHSDFRRQRIGTALLRHMAKHCPTPKLFASTNSSNQPMRLLLEREGFCNSGIIQNLDEGDPELVYFKRRREK